MVSQVPEMEHNDSQVQDQQDVDNDNVLEFRRSKRARKTRNYGPNFLVYFVEGSRDTISNCVPYCFNVESDPLTYEEAMSSPNASFWKEAIDDEMASIMGNGTWKLVDLPPRCKPIGCKWVFKTKKNIDGSILKFKARLVAKGNTQKEGIDYFDTYAPVARTSSYHQIVASNSLYTSSSNSSN